ncbi:alpha/beta hydrolase-fold protein [Streptomyces sp. NPDC088745]|uniref:alpha/beta hydrolase-fold protein n=1 Tax=Streptomyces sp. NPDC088745 TaxID=3365884 RepID=UPI00380E70DD
MSGGYRVGTRARNWGVIGNSTGGYCALKPGTHHPGRFAASAGLSPYCKAAENLSAGDLFHGDKKPTNRADLFRSPGQVPAGRSPLPGLQFPEG